MGLVFCCILELGVVDHVCELDSNQNEPAKFNKVVALQPHKGEELLVPLDTFVLLGAGTVRKCDAAQMHP